MGFVQRAVSEISGSAGWAPCLAPPWGLAGEHESVGGQDPRMPGCWPLSLLASHVQSRPAFCIDGRWEGGEARRGGSRVVSPDPSPAGPRPRLVQRGLRGCSRGERRRSGWDGSGGTGPRPALSPAAPCPASCPPELCAEPSAGTGPRDTGGPSGPRVFLHLQAAVRRAHRLPWAPSSPVSFLPHVPPTSAFAAQRRPCSPRRDPRPRPACVPCLSPSSHPLTPRAVVGTP